MSENAPATIETDQTILKNDAISTGVKTARSDELRLKHIQGADTHIDVANAFTMPAPSSTKFRDGNQQESLDNQQWLSETAYKPLNKDVSYPIGLVAGSLEELAQPEEPVIEGPLNESQMEQVQKGVPLEKINPPVRHARFSEEKV